MAGTPLSQERPRRRILVLNERDPRHPKAGGAEVHVLEMARELSALGHEVTQLACGFRGAPEREEMAGLRVRRLGPLAAYYPRLVAITRSETRAGRFDVVVEHLNKIPFFAPLYSAVPVLALNHHLFGESAFVQASWPVAATVVALERLIPRAYRDTRFLAVSESSRQDLVQRGIAPGRIGIVHNGIRFPARAAVPVPERPLRLAYLGRLEPYKRVDLLLRATAALRERFPALDLVVVGRGSERERLEALARGLGLGGHVRFAGFVPDDERDALIGSARVCVCPSVKEGWGLTVIEANALGVPVVATDAPGLRDAVRRHRTGLLVPDAPAERFVAGLCEAVGGLLADEPRLVALADAARGWAHGFDWAASARQMDAAIEEALSPAGSALGAAAW